MLRRKTNYLALGLVLLALALVACSESGDPTDPGGNNTTDTTAPQVAGANPTNSETGVGQDQPIIITFSEPMDPASASGNVTLSTGSVTSTNWTDSRTLSVSHSLWSEGAEITVTLATGFADEAGNNLATAFNYSFFVESTTLLVLETNPAEGDVDVNRDAGIQVLFSHEMNLTSIEANTTISSGVALIDYPFTLQSEETGVILNPDDRLPASTLITVTIGAAVENNSGNALGADQVLTFTTGDEIDETPPTVISVVPANNSVIQPDVGYFQITFSEPINPQTLSPSSWNVELAILIMAEGGEPTWSEGGTVVTVPLPSPLPAGLPMEITFNEFEDVNGVAQASPWTWEAEVTGSPDYYPAIDGLELTFGSYEEGGTLGNSTPEWNYEGMEYLKIEMQPNSSFRITPYESDFITRAGEYEVYKKLSDQVQWLGFESNPEGIDSQEMLFDSPLKYLPLPLTAGTWNSSTTVTVPEEGTYSATINGTVSGPLDLDIDSDGSEDMFFKDAWRVIRVMEISLDSTPAISETDTTWYSVSLGPVEISGFEESTMDDEWYYSEKWRFIEID